MGKSTLVNAIVGHKVAIVSDKPQTTRRAIRGVATTPDRQLVLVDLPGVQRPRDALTQRMQSRVERELADSDVALLIINGEEGVGPGDRFLAALLREAKLPVVIAVNKIDRLNRSRTMIALEAAAELDVGEDVFPISARTGSGVVALTERLGELLPEGPFFFPEEDTSDQVLEVHLAELVREQVLRRTFQEVPHSVEVIVEEIEEPREDLTRHPRAHVGRDGLPEGHPHRLRRADDQGGRHGCAPRARQGAGDPGAPRAVGARAARLARRRPHAGPPGHRIGRPSSPLSPFRAAADNRRDRRDRLKDEPQTGVEGRPEGRHG